jgi:ribonuclease HI
LKTFSKKRKNLIFKYFDISLSRTSLVKLAYKLLDNTSDGSVIDLGNTLVESTFAFIIMDENFNELGSFMSSNRFWISSYRAETFGLLTSLIVLPYNASVKVYTDSQSMIKTFNKLYNQRKNIKIRNKLKIPSSNLLWITVLEIIEKLQLKVELLKVKAHADDKYNNMVDNLTNLARQEFEDLILDLRYENIEQLS